MSDIFRQPDPRALLKRIDELERENYEILQANNRLARARKPNGAVVAIKTFARWFGWSGLLFMWIGFLIGLFSPLSGIGWVVGHFIGRAFESRR